MKKYHIYGMGNALLDVDYEITPAFLERHGITKGIRTLINAEGQEKLAGALGEETLRKHACGGSAANTLVMAQLFGAECYMSCKVANDKAGDMFHQDLVEVGVDSNLTETSRPDGVTGQCTVLVTHDADRTMNTFLGVSDQFCEADIDCEALKNSEYLYVEGYLMGSPKAREMAFYAKEKAKEFGVKIALTLSDPAAVEAYREHFEAFIGEGVDVLFCNEEEALCYTGEPNVDKAVNALKPLATHFIITCGIKGALLYNREKLIHVKSYPVKAFDTVGAGDVYAGAFLYGLTHGFTFKRAGRLASIASAMVVSKYGPRLTLEDAKYILKICVDESEAESTSE